MIIWRACPSGREAAETNHERALDPLIDVKETTCRV